MNIHREVLVSKVPEVTLVFWIIKILCTTIVCGALLAVIGAAYFCARISHVLLFWAASILTRPLGAVVGDFLDKPRADGALELSRYTATAALLALIVFCIFAFSHRAA